MGWFDDFTAVVAPFFIIMSPVISYSDQAFAMHRNKSSSGFSLDITLIMLVASFLRIFYWPYEQYDMSLLIQSFLMVLMQVILLKVALDHRPAPSTKGGEGSLPFSGVDEGIWGFQRPYNFWQWRSPRSYWMAVFYFVGGLIILELLLSHIPGLYAIYANLIGPLGLAVEATLPIPQIIANTRSRSCKGFRISLLVSWIGGDAMKLYWFFTSPTAIPAAFKICGTFQASCDAFLGVQYWMYGEGPQAQDILKEHPMKEMQRGPPPGARGHSRSLTPSRRPTFFSDTEE